jgi:RimJ/RimL family protein N-acetyltransferase
MDAFDTERLHLRPLDECDEALYCTLYCTPELMRNIAAPMTREAASRSFAIACRRQSPLVQRWIVVDRDSGEDIGQGALVGTGDGPEIGVMLLAHAHGRGYGFEAMDGIVDHGFRARALTWIYAHQSVADNPPVVRMMRRLGFTALAPTAACPRGGEWELRHETWAAMRASRG